MDRQLTPSRRAQVRYTRRVLGIMIVYTAAIFAGVALRKAGMLDGPALVAAALVPGICVALVFWAIGRLIVETEDEFVKMLLVRQTLVATGVALGLATLHGFLSMYDLVPRIDAYWWPVAFFGGLFVGSVSNRLTYGSWGNCR